MNKRYLSSTIKTCLICEKCAINLQRNNEDKNYRKKKKKLVACLKR